MGQPQQINTIENGNSNNKNFTNYEAIGIKEDIDKNLLSSFKKYPYGYSLKYTRNYGEIEGITEDLVNGTIKNIQNSGIMKYVEENILNSKISPYLLNKNSKNVYYFKSCTFLIFFCIKIY